LTDLRNSELTDDTLQKLDIRSVAPYQLNVLPASWKSQVRNAYALPYFGLDGTKNCFERFKLFPAVKTTDGKTAKYWQEPGTAPRLYFPPLTDWQALASDSGLPLWVTEGEKKAACLTQHGHACIGIAGVWCWRERLDTGQILTVPELELFTWKGRRVEMVPDSDVWRKEKQSALSGFYALAVELTARGAAVDFIRLPELNGPKVGLDDWIHKTGDPWWQHEWPSSSASLLNPMS
jgi:hypothetical protein